MPFFNAPYKYGNLYIDFQIDFPLSLKVDELKKITEILKNERLHKTIHDGKNDEQYFLSDYKLEDENTNPKGGRSQDRNNDDDDEENEGGSYHKSVNCANQ